MSISCQPGRQMPRLYVLLLSEPTVLTLLSCGSNSFLAKWPEAQERAIDASLISYVVLTVLGTSLLIWEERQYGKTSTLLRRATVFSVVMLLLDFFAMPAIQGA